MARNMRNVDLNLLPVFSALMRDKNLSHTAENLGMTQPAVSQALKRLRSLYNDPLFERKGGIMQPTLKADAIAKSVDSIINNVIDTLPEQDKFDPATSKKHFHINIVGVPHRLFMTEIVKQLSIIAPSISLTVYSDQVVNMEKSLREREFDLQIDYFQGQQNGCHQQAIYPDELYVVARKDHPRLGSLTEITLEQFLDEFHAVLLPRTKNLYPLNEVLKNIDLERKIRYTNGGFRNIIETVAVTDYICTMPLGMVNSLPNSADYIYFKPPFVTKKMDMYMNWHWAMEHYPSHRWIRNLFIEICKNIGVKKL